jgi:hypothetical protein
MEHRMLEELCRAAVRTGSGFRRKVGRQLIGSSRTNTPCEKLLVSEAIEMSFDSH